MIGELVDKVFSLLSLTTDKSPAEASELLLERIESPESIVFVIDFVYNWNIQYGLFNAKWLLDVREHLINSVWDGGKSVEDRFPARTPLYILKKSVKRRNNDSASSERSDERNGRPPDSLRHD